MLNAQDAHKNAHSLARQTHDMCFMAESFLVLGEHEAVELCYEL